MTDEEWLKERAAHLARLQYLDFDEQAADITSFGQECVERGKAEQDKAIAAERERAYAEGQRSMIGPNPGTVQIEEAFERGQHSILARLENPDEALVEAALRAYECHDVGGSLKRRGRPPSDLMRVTIRAAAAALAEIPENNNG